MIQPFWRFARISALPMTLLLGGVLLGAGCAPLSDPEASNCTALSLSRSDSVTLAINGGSLSTGPAAQAFLPVSTTTVSTVDVALKAVVPTGSGQGFSLTLSIQTDLAGSSASTPSEPSGTTLGSQTIAVADMDLSTTFSKIITFSPGSVSVEQGVIYWIVISSSASPSTTNYVTWAGSLSANYSSGKPLSYLIGVNSWTATSLPGGQDQYFRVCGSE